VLERAQDDRLHWREAARQGRLTIPGDGSDYLSLVHVSDMAAALARASVVDVPGPGLLLDIVDDEPVQVGSLFAYVASLEKAPKPPTGGPRMLSSFRVSNARTRRVLAWEPRFRSYRDGIA
jgi:nucleoside-diphosphate-sugar epimerase